MTSRAAPTVQEFMTPSPATVTTDTPLTEAHDLMRSRNVRHLPVMEGDKLAGVISERDVQVVRSLRSVDVDHVNAGLVMDESPVVVGPGTLLSDVAALMVDRKDESSVVLHEGKVVGIFTTVDALLALHRLCAPRS